MAVNGSAGTRAGPHAEARILADRPGSATPRPARFEALVLPHLDAAYSLARFLSRDPEAARDIVQEACLRAFRSIDACRSVDARPWLFAIVRNWLPHLGRSAAVPSGDRAPRRCGQAAP